MAKLTGSSTKPLVRPETDRSDDGVEGDLRRRRFGRGRCSGLRPCEHSGLGLLEGEEGSGAPGHGGTAWGRRRAWLQRGRGGDGVGHGGGARERGVGGEWRCPTGSRRCVELIHPAPRRGGGAGRQPAAWRALRSLSGTCLLGWPASSSLERRWAGPAGGPGAGRQVSLFHFFCFLFFFFNTSATLLN